ncbi:hypothetical protein ACLJYM_22195 [Rhizobium giardinii]|uniref:hypothetical protein n=1 Tax=Rhizobium giardinii TaxID=56731 RepID=UPI0039E06383
MQEMRSRSGGATAGHRNSAGIVLVSALLAATFWVLLPFVGVLTYAVILATATAGPGWLFLSAEGVVWLPSASALSLRPSRSCR